MLPSPEKWVRVSRGRNQESIQSKGSSISHIHTDVHPNSIKEETTRRFIELREAYETLSDPLSRKLYYNELASSSFGWSNNGRVKMEKNVTSYSRDVWERQLAGLRRRSSLRMERRNGDNECM
ncbi:hypothetical protein LIER_13281 [Lithospermum erythrorhizon]|uniref:J domain-containing protein n=1 Tax=Lithospermum erythrorhizon TaxID=34254 RepID=A0AAV3PUW3_LITER